VAVETATALYSGCVAAAEEEMGALEEREGDVAARGAREAAAAVLEAAAVVGGVTAGTQSPSKQDSSGVRSRSSRL